MQSYDAGSCSEFFDKCCSLGHNAGIFYNLSLAYFSEPYLDAFSRNNAANLHIKVYICIASVLGAADEFLTDGIWYPFSKECQLFSIFYEGVFFTGGAIPGFDDTGPVQFLF